MTTAIYRVNITLANNEDLLQPFQLTDTAGAPLNLTGATLEMAVATMSGVEVLNATTGNGKIVLTAAATGNFEIRIPAASISALNPGVYQHDCIYTLAGATHRIWSGTLTVEKGIS